MNDSVNTVLIQVLPVCLVWYFMVSMANIVTFSTQGPKCNVYDFQADMTSAAGIWDMLRMSLFNTGETLFEEFVNYNQTCQLTLLA